MPPFLPARAAARRRIAAQRRTSAQALLRRRVTAKARYAQPQASRTASTAKMAAGRQPSLSTQRRLRIYSRGRGARACALTDARYGVSVMRFSPAVQACEAAIRLLHGRYACRKRCEGPDAAASGDFSALAFAQASGKRQARVRQARACAAAAVRRRVAGVEAAMMAPYSTAAEKRHRWRA